MIHTATETVAMASTDKEDKKVKQEKGERKSKKRHRELEDGEDRQHKRSKSEVPTEGENAVSIKTEPIDPTPSDGELSGHGKKKDKKKKKKKGEDAEVQDDTQMADAIAKPEPVASVDLNVEPMDKRKKKKSKKDRSTKTAKEPTAEPEPVPEVELSVIKGDDVSEEKREKKSKKKDKKKHKKEEEETVEVEVADSQVAQPAEEFSGALSEEQPKAKDKKRKDKKERHRKKHAEDDEVIPETQETGKQSTAAAGLDNDAMDFDFSPNASSPRKFGELPSKPYPFFIQKISQYTPLYPIGIIEPIEGAVDQHVKPLLNRYAPLFKGVLLGYQNATLGETPGKRSLTEESNMEDQVLLESINEYAITFTWLTVEAEIFRPSRGAFCEGKVNLQSEGHLGVVCWGLFNASIEAARLPKGWRWKSLQSSKEGDSSTDTHLPTPEPNDEGQMHVTGCWVDEKGQRVQGTVRFRIKNFDVGGSGEYLSIEGTMLDEEAEKQLASEEKEKARRRKLKQQGGSWRFQKHMPEFSMTKFGVEDEQDGVAARGLGSNK